MYSVSLHYLCVQKIRCKQFVMSEVKEGNENVNHRRKLLNGTNCLREVFVYPCAACLSQSIIGKDKPPRGNECPRSAGKLAGPGSDCPRQQRTHTHPALSAQELCCDLVAVSADPEIGRHGACWPANIATLQTSNSGYGWLGSILNGTVGSLASRDCLSKKESSFIKKDSRRAEKFRANQMKEDFQRRRGPPLASYTHPP